MDHTEIDYTETGVKMWNGLNWLWIGLNGMLLWSVFWPV